MPTSSVFTRKGRALLPGQVSELTIIDATGNNRQVIFTADEIIEAPNWTPDGQWLIFNAGGELWRIGTDGTALAKIDTGSIRDLNNDHVLSFDGRTIYLSNQSDGQLYAMPLSGGEPRRVSNTHDTPFHYYLHGVSPDETTLAIRRRRGQRPGPARQHVHHPVRWWARYTPHQRALPQ